MKKQLVIFFLVAAMALGVQAQENSLNERDLPVDIQTSFKTHFSDASDASWKKKAGNYKVSFKRNGVKNIASFNEGGTLTSRGIEIKENELPAPIRTAVSTSYKDRKIEEIYKMEKEGTTSFLVKLKGDPATKLMYSQEGQLIKDKY
ncbi:PepSY-like domain-containing protein [Flavihumibacter sp. CACIAM 22H1]|uniref:PepSY-like domain-containing protein n=1 Tax=Flavihumibacter sp. CACIAM 22H1 TaxID=1812911 RepID=UPI0007A912E8|nr:PepSY-like domain-containing protein [Flavihumibacter sp. CACIAM 22H1]KYP14133.1 MAG: hypothetical protein A1D16_19980 [Flavihumibacter sp. CACIAM 22H1]